MSSSSCDVEGLQSLVVWNGGLGRVLDRRGGEIP